MISEEILDPHAKMKTYHIPTAQLSFQSSSPWPQGPFRGANHHLKHLSKLFLYSNKSYDIKAIIMKICCVD